MRFLNLLALLTLAWAAVLGQSDPPKPLPEFNGSPLDTSVQPCDDFYQYVCGPWMAANPIPPDQSTWSRFDELREHNRTVLREILEQASADNASRTPVEQKIGDFYASCMDESAIDSKGTAALEPEMDRIRALSSKSAIVEEVAHLHSRGVHVLFRFDSTQDFKDSTQVIAEEDQGGLGLPNRDYYFKQDAKSAEIREKYAAHVQKMLELLGHSPQKASAEAKVVMQIETALAKGSLDPVSRRDPAKLYHKWPAQRVASLTPAFAWPKYLEGVHAPPIRELNVAVPDFFKEMQSLIDSTSLDDWKTYLAWHLVHEEAPLLPTAFVNEDFNFYSKTLRGAKEIRPRWKRCVDFTDAELGEALGQKYVERAFPPEAKQRMLKMVHELEAALGRDISQLDWMTPATKKQALVKLRAIANKIGYPDKWRDYSSVRIVRGDALGNIMRADAFEFHRQLEKIGKPVDRSEWFMTPPTVNAYYDPQMNNVNFPAGILQPPFFSNKADDAVNFGGIGAVIGHELTHGFDDEGRQFDAQGNLRDWWTPRDGKEFEERAACIADEYSQFTPVDDARINGKLTLGENTADNGGLRIAYMALLASLAGQEPAKIDSFTPEQRLFLNWGAVWCTNMTDQYARLMVNTNPHSPGRFRVNGVLYNMPEFQKAFACKPGQPMAPKNRCHVW